MPSQFEPTDPRAWLAAILVHGFAILHPDLQTQAELNRSVREALAAGRAEILRALPQPGSEKRPTAHEPPMHKLWTDRDGSFHELGMKIPGVSRELHADKTKLEHTYRVQVSIVVAIIQAINNLYTDKSPFKDRELKIFHELKGHPAAPVMNNVPSVGKLFRRRALPHADHGWLTVIRGDGNFEFLPNHFDDSLPDSRGYSVDGWEKLDRESFLVMANQHFARHFGSAFGFHRRFEPIHESGYAILTTLDDDYGDALTLDDSLIIPGQFTLAKPGMSL